VTKLKYLEVDRFGHVWVRVRSRAFIAFIADEFSLLDGQERRRFLKALNEDIGRFNDVAEIVEEVVEYVFRGKCEKDMGSDHFDPRGRMTLIFRIRTEWFYIDIELIASIDEKKLLYSSMLTIKLFIYGGIHGGMNSTAQGLLDNVLDMLAELFEEPKFRRLKEDRVVTIYRSEVSIG
jgi:hypothetical protein